MRNSPGAGMPPPTPFRIGDFVGFRAHKVDAILFIVEDIRYLEGVAYLKASRMLFMASECRLIRREESG